MTKLFAPYIKEIPATINIKGHNVLILTSQHEDMWEGLPAVGGKEIREIEYAEEGPAPSATLSRLAEQVNAGIVITPPGISVSTIIHSLESQLPWVH